MLNKDLFLSKSQINDFDKIIDSILNGGITPGTLGIENVGDIVSYLDRWDKNRNIKDPELKHAVFTVIKTLLDMDVVELMWKDSIVEEARLSPPHNEENIFNFLNEHWDKDDGSGLIITYLVSFKKKGQTWPQ